MITIQNLEIRFDVEGDDDRQAFAKLFNEFIKKWAAQAEEHQAREKKPPVSVPSVTQRTEGTNDHSVRRNALRLDQGLPAYRTTKAK